MLLSSLRFIVTLADDFDDAFARLAAEGFDDVYTVPDPASNSGRGARRWQNGFLLSCDEDPDHNIKRDVEYVD